jgi:hypothetical protein
MKSRNLIITLGTLLLVVVCLVAQVAQLNKRLQAKAYMAVFRELFPPKMMSNYSNRATFRISVDLSNVLHKNPNFIKKEIENYLKDSSFIILWDDWASLAERGLIVDSDRGGSYFSNGALIEYHDVRLTKSTLETEASIWFASLGAEGGVYVVDRILWMWRLKPVSWWIS